MPAIKETNLQTTAILLAPRLGHGEECTLIELDKLLSGVGVQVVEVVAQRSTPTGSPHLIGSGKLEELQARVAHYLNDTRSGGELWLVVAADITPSEQRTLEQAVRIQVMDRSSVILRVFEQRAGTSLARLEVALARARYELPRVRDDVDLGAREGGGGRAGRGHSSVELKKQYLRRTIADLQRRIAAAERATAVQRKCRAEERRVALVGYTNVGKSSLLQALCGCSTYVADELFATLSPTIRTIPGTSPGILVSDTVGFMRALPHELLQSFRSTLAEAVDADLRVIVVDGSAPDFQEQLAATQQVLIELGAAEHSNILVFNKVDRLTGRALAELRLSYPDALFISAQSEPDVVQLRQMLVDFFDGTAQEVTLVVPYSDGKTLAKLRAVSRVLSQRAKEHGMELTVRASPRDLARMGLS